MIHWEENLSYRLFVMRPLSSPKWHLKKSHQKTGAARFSNVCFLMTLLFWTLHPPYPTNFQFVNGLGDLRLVKIKVSKGIFHKNELFRSESGMKNYLWKGQSRNVGLSRLEKTLIVHLSFYTTFYTWHQKNLKIRKVYQGKIHFWYSMECFKGLQVYVKTEFASHWSC